ncbi:hypothetical protein KY363_06410 [Candidatus Woesearchaeota archaeon]|nr:hypothetical protein [Candidatus Woesearchaeota archaeon]
MIDFKASKIVLQNHEPSMNPTSEELARIIMTRLGLEPRKSGATDKMYRVMTELYERAKVAHREKKPEHAVMTVEEMGAFAGITRQTMYDYLRRWLELSMIVKTSYIVDNKVVIGYKLNGSTLETSFEKARQQVLNNLELTNKYIQELQRRIKNEKISQTQKMNSVINNDDISEPELATDPAPQTIADNQEPPITA